MFTYNKQIIKYTRVYLHTSRMYLRVDVQGEILSYQTCVFSVTPQQYWGFIRPMEYQLYLQTKTVTDVEASKHSCKTSVYSQYLLGRIYSEGDGSDKYLQQLILWLDGMISIVSFV